MANWYFYESQQKYGPITTDQLKILVEQGRIVKETIIESEDGRQSVAGQVKGLVFPELPPVFVTPPIQDDKPEVRRPHAKKSSNARESAIGILNFDLTRIFGGLGDVDRQVLINAGVVFKIYYWLFNASFILGLLISLIAALTIAGGDGDPGGIIVWIIALPFVLLFWFLMRITVKLPLEVIKVILKLNDSIDNN